MINFRKHLQLNETRRCFWYIVMLCKFISITGTCISPETDFPSAYCMFLFEGYNCNTLFVQYRQFYFLWKTHGHSRTWLQVKKNILKREVWVNNRLQLHHRVWRKYSNTTISCKTGTLHFKKNRLIAAFFEMLVWDQVMITKREQLAKPHDQLSKRCGITRQDNSTLVFLSRHQFFLESVFQQSTAATYKT